MNKANKELLEQVVNTKLELVLDSTDEEKEDKIIFKEAMDAIDRTIELDKLEAAEREFKEKLKADEKEREEKLKADEMFKKQQIKWDLVKFGIELGATVILIPTINYAFNTRYATRICNFEKDYTFTTTPGKGLGSLFRFRK